MAVLPFVVVTIGLDVDEEDDVEKFEVCAAWAAAAACAACAWAYAEESEAPDTPPVGEVDAFWKPERARKAERKFEKKGLLVVILIYGLFASSAVVEGALFSIRSLSCCNDVLQSWSGGFAVWPGVVEILMRERFFILRVHRCL